MKVLDLARSRRDDAPPNDPAAAAAYWVARTRLGLMSARDEAALRGFLADAGNAALFAEADAAVEDAGAIAALPEVRDMRAAALSAGRRPAPGWRAAAAAAIGAVALGGALWLAQDPGAPSVQVASSEAQPLSPTAARRYETRFGERQNVRLDDGSIVALNTATAMEVAYTAGRRDVRLLRGQALFEVAKDTSRPFVVTAGGRQVTALGTAFDVRVDGEKVKVVLVEGRVVVRPTEPSGLERIVPILARRSLDPGEQLTAADGDVVSVTEADPDQATSWRRGQVIFRDDPLATAVAEMNRYSTKRLVIDDEAVGQLKVSGVFAAARREDFIAAVTAYYPLEARDVGGGVTALVWRDRSVMQGGTKKTSPSS